jgi:hypothetical protein
MGCNRLHLAGCSRPGSYTLFHCLITGQGLVVDQLCGLLEEGEAAAAKADSSCSLVRVLHIQATPEEETKGLFQSTKTNN